MTPGRVARAGRMLSALVPLAFLGIFFVYPVASILGRGLVPGGVLDLSPIADVFGDPGLRAVAWFTAWQAALSTLVTMAVALPAAYVVARYEFRGRAVIRAAVMVPFVLPTVVVGSAFLALGIRASLGAILLAHVFFNYAVVIRVVGTLWERLDPHQAEAARVLGASRWQAFTRVTLPALRPALAASASIVFLFTFTSFGVILVLGGPTRATLETEIYRQTAQLLDLRTAAALSVVQLLAVIALFTAVGSIERRRSVALSLRSERGGARRPRSKGERGAVAANLAVMALLLGAPLGVLVARSFATPGGASFDYYGALGHLRSDSVLFVAPTDAILNSLAFAATATAIALAVGGMAAFVVARSRRARVLDAALTLPLGVSAVTVGFGFLIALDEAPFDLRTSWILIPVAQALVAIPFVVRVVAPMLRAIDPRLREAAATLGASPRRVWREIDVPIVGRAFLAAAGFAFAISLGEFGATVFLARPDTQTLPVVIYRLLGQPGDANFGAAMAASVLLAAVTAASILVIDRLRPARGATF